MSIDDGPPSASNNADVVYDVDAAAADDSTGEAIPLAPIHFIRGLSILPPRQKNHAKTQQRQQSVEESQLGVVALPPLRPEEPVASLRGALGEMVGYAHLTRYRLVVERLPAKGDVNDEDEKSSVVATTRQNRSQNKHVKRGGSGGSSGDASTSTNTDFIWSAYTLRDADVDMSPSHKSLVAREACTTEDEIVLDDYGDLSILLPLLEGQEVASDVNVVAAVTDAVPPEDETSSPAAGTTENGGVHDMGKQNIIHYDASNTIAIRLVLERYDLASVCDHMAKVRSLLKGNAPYVASLVGCAENGGGGVGEKSDNGEVGDDENAKSPEANRMTTTKGTKGEKKVKKKTTTTKEKDEESKSHDNDNETNVSLPLI